MPRAVKPAFDPLAAAAEAAVAAVPGIHLLPILHDSLDLAAVTRAVLAALDPAAVAVELPTTLADAAERAVARLPRVSLLLSERPGEEALAWAVAPGDPLVEALRWAHERGRRRFFIDPDLLDAEGGYGERHRDPVPDSYALWQLGPAAFLGGLADALAARPAGDGDRRREAGMAHHLQRARRQLDEEGVEGPLVALVGAAHLRRLAALLEHPAAVPFARVRQGGVLVRHLHPESLTALLPDAPLGHAAWELLRRPPEDRPPAPPLAAVLDGAAGESSGGGRGLSLVRESLAVIRGAAGDPEAGETPRDRQRQRQRRIAAWTAAHARLDRSRLDGARLDGARLDGSRPDGARPDPPRNAAPAVDRWALGEAIWTLGARAYRQQSREEVAPWQRRRFLDFAHRYARVQGRLVPGLYEWTVAGRGVGDDNLAWELFEVARSYPWQEELADDLATVKVDGDELDLGQRKIRFRRRFLSVKRRVTVPVRPRPAVDRDAWLAGFDGGSLCSYPPEDLVVEDYGRRLRSRAVGLLAAERSSSEPFTTGLLDGVDLKETLRRRLAEGGDAGVWVRKEGRVPGGAGAVVVIFEREGSGGAYPYLMTWLGEHDEESDMAFYSTDPTESVVGPGIMRATYGGFLLVHPPGRLADVWTDPDYAEAREKGEVLLMAAIDYSLEPNVVHVGPRAPSPALHGRAAERGKRIVHLPLGSLTPAVRKRVRVAHLLVGRDKRKIARDYIF